MEKTGGSKLLQMKARFQQKQLQERELKIASLYETQQARALDRVRHSPSSRPQPSPPPGPPMSVHPGKVRQMFEERRTKAGIDKSYPLQPIHNTDRARKPLPNGFSKVTASNSMGSTKVSTTTRTIVDKKRQGPAARTIKLHKTENMVNGSGDLNHNHQPDLNVAKRTLPKSNGELISRIDEVDRNDNNYLLENETFPHALAPARTPRSPEPKEPKRPPRRNPSRINSPPTKSPPPRAAPKSPPPRAVVKSPPPRAVSKSPSPRPVAPPRRAASDNAVLKNNKPKEAMQCSVNSSGSRAAAPVRPAAVRKTAESRSAALTGAGEGVACAVCGRRFAADRIDRHQEICSRASTKKRKPFDALKHRLAGTEAEPFISTLRKKPGTASNSTTKVNKPLNSNWRQKHDEFIQAIRAAKQVQQHLKAGGKLSDLPPPTPSENPDYVQCPHCKRRFNQAAAERHIPKCAGFQFNKSKSPPKGNRR